MPVEQVSMMRKPPTEDDIGADVIYWPIDNRTEEGILDKFDKDFIWIRLPSGRMLQCLYHQVHRGHFGEH